MSTYAIWAPTELCLLGCPRTFRIFGIPGYQVVAWSALPSSGLSTYSTRIRARAPCAPLCPLWGRMGSRKLKGGIRNKISSREVLGLDFYVFPNLTNFLFLFLCLFLPQIFLFFLSVQISEFKLVNVRFYISFQPAPHKLPPPFLFISWSIQPLWAGTLLYTPGRFSWGWSWTGAFWKMLG